MSTVTVTADQQAVFEVALAAGEVTTITFERTDAARYYQDVSVAVHAGTGIAVYADTADTVEAKDPNVIMIPVGEWARLTLDPGQTRVSVVSVEGATISAMRA